MVCPGLVIGKPSFQVRYGSTMCSLHADADSVARGLQLAGMESLPSLYSLRVGWGFGGAAMLTLCSASAFLTELRTGVGAALSDWGLQQAATSCPHLRVLRLSFATVSDVGVACLLRFSISRLLQRIRSLRFLNNFGSTLKQGSFWPGIRLDCLCFSQVHSQQSKSVSHYSCLLCV